MQASLARRFFHWLRCHTTWRVVSLSECGCNDSTAVKAIKTSVDDWSPSGGDQRAAKSGSIGKGGQSTYALVGMRTRRLREGSYTRGLGSLPRSGCMPHSSWTGSHERTTDQHTTCGALQIQAWALACIHLSAACSVCLPQLAHATRHSRPLPEALAAALPARATRHLSPNPAAPHPPCPAATTPHKPAKSTRATH